VSALAGEDQHGAPRWSYALLVAAALCWSLNGVLIKSVAMAALAIAFYRSAVAAAFLAPFAWRRRERLGRASVEVAAAYTVTVILLVVATKGTSAANAIILHYTAPFFVFLIGIPLLGERPGRRDWISLGLAMGGVGFIFASAASADWVGIACGVGSGIAFAMLILLLRLHHSRDPLWVTFLNNAVVALLLLPWVWSQLLISRHDLVLMLTMGIVQLGVPYVMFSTAVRHVRAGEASLISLLEPLLNPVWVALAVGEIPARWTLVGGSVVLIALVSRYAFRSRRHLQPEPVMGEQSPPPQQGLPTASDSSGIGGAQSS
jgi:drug/metabolite transporter (DMT)-like permease